MRMLLYIFLLLVVAGCSYSSTAVTKELDCVQEIMCSDPRTAFERLNALEVAEFEDSATMARWALMYSEAMVANNLAAPADTIVDIAVDYYGSHSDYERLRRAKQVKSMLQLCGDTDALVCALYAQKEKEYMLYRERTERLRYIFAGAMLLFCAICIIVWQRNRLRIRNIQNEALVAEASSLREGLSRHMSECSVMESKLLSMLSRRFNVIDDLCETYYATQGTKAERKSIVDRVRSQIDALKADEGLFSEMESAVNECLGDMLALFAEELPNLKRDDYRMMVYLACNLSNRTIALLIGESVDVVYKRKSRLKARISASGCPHSALFLSVF